MLRDIKVNNSDGNWAFTLTQVELPDNPIDGECYVCHDKSKVHRSETHVIFKDQKFLLHRTDGPASIIERDGEITYRFAINNCHVPIEMMPFDDETLMYHMIKYSMHESRFLTHVYI